MTSQTLSKVTDVLREAEFQLSNLTRKEVSLKMIIKADAKLSPEALIRLAEREFDVVLTQKSRAGIVTDVRGVVATLLYQQGYSQKQIAALLGGYERSTVVHWLEVAKDRFQWGDQDVREYWRRLLRIIPADVRVDLPQWYVQVEEV